MLESIKDAVCRANKDLPRHGLVTSTWGNASQIDRPSGNYVIKPSGVGYDRLGPGDMVVVSLRGGVVEGRYRPSSDSMTHKEIYKAFPEVGGIVHTHSTYATAWAQACRGIPCYGTTHADYFYGDIPCLRFLQGDEVRDGYEENTGRLIVEYFADTKRDIMSVPAVLCAGHGVFAWGGDAAGAVHNAVAAEEVARMAYLCEAINPKAGQLPIEIQDKHYFRKHGEYAYYGQD